MQLYLCKVKIIFGSRESIITESIVTEVRYVGCLITQKLAPESKRLKELMEL